MDWLLERQDRIERKLAKRHLAEGDPVLYDVSSSYYEGRTCPLMQFGHNRDGKRDRPIVVYGVLADSMGRPLAVQAYASNTGDPTTVGDQVEKVRGSVRPQAGSAGGGPRPADRDADQPSEALSGTGVDLGPAPPPDSPSGGERGGSALPVR